MFLCLLFERMMVILTPQTTNVLKWTIFQSLSYLPQKKNPLQPCLSPEMRKKHEFLVSLLNLYWTRRRVFTCLHFKVQRQDVWITWDRDIFGEQLAVGSCVKSQHMCVTGCYHKNMMHILRWNAFFLCFSFFFFKLNIYDTLVYLMCRLFSPGLRVDLHLTLVFIVPTATYVFGWLEIFTTLGCLGITCSTDFSLLCLINGRLNMWKSNARCIIYSWNSFGP